LTAQAFWRVRQDTCCLNIIEWDGRRFSIVTLNDTCHLEGMEKDAADF
jgi:broad specificity phosphatase PhoE